MFTVVVMYPAGGKFDLGYYMKTHMPLVDARWRSLGLKDWTVTKINGAPNGAPTYQVITTLTFDSGESFQKAVAAHGPEVMGDIPNFTDVQAVMQLGEPVTA